MRSLHSNFKYTIQVLTFPDGGILAWTRCQESEKGIGNSVSWLSLYDRLLRKAFGIML
jgi:hypothetical protein